MTIGNRIKMGVKPSKIEWGKIVAEWEFWASGFEKENEIIKLKMEMVFRRTQILDDFQLGRIGRAEAQGRLDFLEEEYCRKQKALRLNGNEVS